MFALLFFFSEIQLCIQSLHTTLPLRTDTASVKDVVMWLNRKALNTNAPYNTIPLFNRDGRDARLLSINLTI